MVRFTEVIEASLEWTALLLFRPFKPKKWLLLCFAALMAGYIQGASNFNLSDIFKSKEQKQAQASITPSSVTKPVLNQETKKSSSLTLGEIFKQGLPGSKGFPVKEVIITLALATLLILLIFMWLSARFSFVFLEDVRNNDASIKMPFKAHKKIGNSLFCFNLFLMAAFLALIGLLVFLCFHALLKLGVFDQALNWESTKKIFFACLPYGLWMLLLVLAGGIVGLITNDLVLVIMFKDRIGVLSAWPKAWDILKTHTSDFIKYIFVKLGLAICAWLIYAVLSWVAFFGLFLPGLIIAGILAIIYALMPAALRGAYLVILSIIGFPIILFLFYCLICIGLPFGVFLRTLGLKFMARLSPRYNLFRFDTG